MTNIELLEKLYLALENKSVYCLGTFGWISNQAMKDRACNSSIVSENRRNIIRNVSSDTFMFDCCGLIKAILWGWNANQNQNYGGAVYGSNDVPDINELGLLNACYDVSSDMNHIEKGEFMWMAGHCGVYVGDNFVIECTPAFDDGVQKTGLFNRPWEKHGKLKYVTYVEEVKSEPKPEPKSIDILAQEVIDGKWGNGDERKQKLTDAGYNYGEVQAKVNDILAPKPVEKPKEIVVGSTVMLNKGAKTYDGVNLASFVYNRKHTVTNLSGDRAVISYKGTVVAAVHVCDLTLA